MRGKTVTVGLFLVAVLGLSVWWGSRVDPAARQGRAAELLMTSPDPLHEDIQRSMDASDEVVRRLHTAGVSNVGAELRARMAAIPVSDADAMAFLEANRRVFGDRGIAEERGTVEELVRIHRLRQQLGEPDPPTVISYP